jgi:hypothetical protein
MQELSIVSVAEKSGLLLGVREIKATSARSKPAMRAAVPSG